MSRDVHDGDTGDFSDSSFEVSIAGSDDIDTMCGNSVHDAVVGVSAFMVTADALESPVARHLERDRVFLGEFLQLSDDAVADADRRGRGEAIEHPLHDVNLVGDGKVDEIRVQQHVERRPQRRIVLEEHGRRDGRRLYQLLVALLGHHRRMFSLRTPLPLQPVIAR